MRRRQANRYQHSRTRRHPTTQPQLRQRQSLITTSSLRHRQRSNYQTTNRIRHHHQLQYHPIQGNRPRHQRQIKRLHTITARHNSQERRTPQTSTTRLQNKHKPSQLQPRTPPPLQLPTLQQLQRPTNQLPTKGLALNLHRQPQITAHELPQDNAPSSPPGIKHDDPGKTTTHTQLTQWNTTAQAQHLETLTDRKQGFARIKDLQSTDKPRRLRRLTGTEQIGKRSQNSFSHRQLTMNVTNRITILRRHRPTVLVNRRTVHRTLTGHHFQQIYSSTINIRRCLTRNLPARFGHRLRTLSNTVPGR